MARRPVCPKCGARVHVVTNKFYGTGLSVHKAIRLCSRCDWVGFESQDPNDRREKVEPAPEPRSWMSRRFGALRRRPEPQESGDSGQEQ